MKPGAYLTAAVGPDGVLTAYVDTPDALSPVPVFPAAEPEGVIVRLGHVGLVLTGDALVPDRAGERAPLTNISPASYTCPPWCTRCRDGEERDIVYDNDSGRALLRHHGGAGGTRPGGWSVALVLGVLLADPPVLGQTGVHVAPPSASPRLLTPAEAARLGEQLTLAALQPRPWYGADPSGQVAS